MILTNNHGEASGQTLLNRLRDSLNKSGTLHVLRQGFDVLGLRKPLRMAQFKPALAMNPDIMQRYSANRLRVVRQVHYSVHNELNIDLVLFLNGLPVATAELKTDFTQSIEDAVESHIIRAIEYWDIERKRYPQYDHCAVGKIGYENQTEECINFRSLLGRFNTSGWNSVLNVPRFPWKFLHNHHVLRIRALKRIV